MFQEISKNECERLSSEDVLYGDEYNRKLEIIIQSAEESIPKSSGKGVEKSAMVEWKL